MFTVKLENIELKVVFLHEKFKKPRYLDLCHNVYQVQAHTRCQILTHNDALDMDTVIVEAHAYCSISDMFDPIHGEKQTLAEALRKTHSKVRIFDKEQRTAIWKAYFEFQTPLLLTVTTAVFKGMSDAIKTMGKFANAHHPVVDVPINVTLGHCEDI